jgi:hypothetical protein
MMALLRRGCCLTAGLLAGLCSVSAAESIGEQLLETPQATLWWASSGWKIRPDLPVPSVTAERVLVRAARNEAEAVQVILTPRVTLTGLTMTVSDLTGLQGAKISAANVDVLRVAYVNITEPTDKSAQPGLWPDPLPPLTGPLDLTAHKHQPFWLRVRVPREAAAGFYTGRVKFAAQGFVAEVPLAIEVYDFTLPDEMTCQTAFGFSPDMVFRYHSVETAADKRVLLEKYFDSFAAHHVSPYDPAPLDRIRVIWPAVKRPPSKWHDWDGARLGTNEVAAGQGALALFDDNRTACVAAGYRPHIAIPPGGLRLKLKYRTALPGHDAMISLNHYRNDGSWMSGCNNDIVLPGSGRWDTLDQALTNFPTGAVAVQVNLWATKWTDVGEKTGLTWFDEVSLRAASGGPELLPGGDFEPPEFGDSGATEAQLQVGLDFAVWDKAVAAALARWKFNTFQIHVQGLGSGTYEGHAVPSLCGFPEGTREYDVILKSYLGGLDRHLRERGWQDKAFVYWFDEPEPSQYGFVRRGCEKLKRFAPNLRRMMTEQPEPALYGGPNLWCPVSPHYDPARAEQRRQAGEHFWWYICCFPKTPYATEFIDHPGTELRVWLWQTFQRRIEGILVWETVWWTSPTAYPDRQQPQNPWEDPMSWVSGNAPLKKRQGWGNGDGRFLYPPAACASGKPAAPVLAPPVDSIRWELLRDGIEDYEYLVMLKRALETIKKLSKEKHRAYAALLEVPPEISKSMTDFARNPAPIEQRRDALARALAELNRKN